MFLRLPALIVVMLTAYIFHVECAPGTDIFGSLRNTVNQIQGKSQPEADLEEAVDQVGDVLTGRRKVEISGNVLTGHLQVSTSSTTEEKIMYGVMAAIALMTLICCCACLKACCCRSEKPPTTIVYQHMPSPAQPAQTPQLTAVQNMAGYKAPPPPYPGTF